MNRLSQGLRSAITAVSAASVLVLGVVVPASLALSASPAAAAACTPGADCTPGSVQFLLPGSYPISGLHVCGIDGDYAPLASAEVDSAYDDPAKFGGGTSEGNYPDSEAFTFTPEPGSVLKGNNHITVSLPRPAEPYADSGSVLPPAQLPTQAPDEQNSSHVDTTGFDPQGIYVKVTLGGTPNPGNRKIRLDVFDPYNPPPLTAAPGAAASSVSGTVSTVTAVGLVTPNASHTAGNTTTDNTARTNSSGVAEFWVTDSDPNGGQFVAAATDEFTSVGLMPTAELDFSGPNQSQLNNGQCPPNEVSGSVSSGEGLTWLLVENGVAYLVPNVTVSNGSGVETADLIYPFDLPTTSGPVTLVALGATSPPGEGTPANPLQAPSTPYPPNAFSISTTQDPVPGYPATAPVFRANDAVSGSASSLASSVASAQVGPNSTVTATATLRDDYYNAVNDTQVAIFQSGAGHANISPAAPATSYPLTASDGTASYTVSDNCAETVNLQADDVTDNVLVAPAGQPSTVPVTFTAGPPVAPDAPPTPPIACSVPPVTSSVSVSSDGSTWVSGSPVNAPADGKTNVTVQVTLADQFGNAVACQQVILAATTSNSRASITPQPPGDPATSTSCPNPGADGYTGADGKATFFVSDATAEQLAFDVASGSATWPPDPVAHPQDVAQINFEGADGDLGVSSVTASSSSAPADGQPLVAVTVTLKDKDGQPLQGKQVTLAGCTNSAPPCTADSTTTITPVTTATDGNGQQTFDVGDSGPPHTVYYRATDASDGVPIAQVAQVAFTLGGVALTASPAVVVADGTGTSTVTFTISDNKGNPVTGVPVSLSLASTSTTATISPVSPQTNSKGAAAFTVGDTAPEQVSYTATATYTPSQGTACVGTSNGDGTCTVTDSVSVKFIAPPNTFTVTPSPTSGVLADGLTSSVVTVTALDVYGKPMAGLPLALAGTGSAQVTALNPVTDNNGQATFEVSDTAAETVTLTPGYQEIPGSGQASGPSHPATGCSGSACTATVAFVKAEADASTIGASLASVPADGSSTTLVTVKLQNGDPSVPINGHAVVLITGSATTTVTPSNVGGYTGVNPQPPGTVTFTVADTKPESLTIYARDTNTGVILSNAVSVTFVATEVQLSTITANPATLPAGGPPGNPATSTVTVKLSLPSCTASLSGHTVKLTANSGTAVISPASAQTDSNGAATFTVSDPAVETVTLTAVDTTCGVTLAKTGTVQFVPSEAYLSTLMISPVSTPAEGPAATLTVTLLTASGTPISGRTVTVPAAAHASVTPLAYPGLAPGVTNASGQAQFAVSDNTVETVTLLAYDGATELDEPGVVAFTANEANQSTVSATVTSLPALGALTTVTVTLTSGGGAPIAGHSVLLAASSTTVSITPATATTNAAGQAQFTVSDPNAESVVLTALDQATGVIVVQTLPVTFTANEQNQSTATASPAIVQTKKTSTITVTLLGANGKPIAGHVVGLATGSTTAKATVLTKGGVTTAAGQIQFSVTDTAPETLSIMVTDTTAGVTLYLPVTVSFVKP